MIIDVRLDPILYWDLMLLITKVHRDCIIAAVSVI